MHRTPKANPDPPADQPPMNDNDVLGDNNILFNADQDHPANLEGFAKEKVTYHPLINGKPPPFFFSWKKKLTVI